MITSPNNGNNNPATAAAAVAKAIADAANEASEWSACVPFLLSDGPNKLNFVRIGMFSMVYLQPHEKEICFQ